jgi:ribonuclease Z
MRTRVSAQRLIVAAITAPLLLCVGYSGRASVKALALSQTQERPGRQSAAASTLKVVVLGSGAGPLVNVQRFGPSILIDAGNQVILFDCGRGATIRLAQIGIPIGRVNRVFLTHLHSDHVIGLPDLFLTAPSGPTGRKVPLEVWGPAGTREMMDYMQRSFAFDLRMRRDEERWSKEGLSVVSHDIEQGVVFENLGLKVIAFLVDHGPVKPAFGYRVEYAGHSVALSGDTRPSENLVKYAQGVDVLIHEATSGDYSRATTQEQREQLEFVNGIHTLPEQAADIFNRVKPRLAVYAHAPVSDDLIARTRKTYAGRVEGADDMMTIEIGQSIEIRRFGR